MASRSICCLVAVFLPSVAAVSLADECDQTAAKVASAVPNLVPKGRTNLPSIQSSTIIFGHRFGGTFEIICAEGLKPAVTIDANTIYPSKEFLDMIAKAGSAETGIAVSAVRAAFARCHQNAMKGGGDNFEIKGAEVGCSVHRDKPELSIFEIRRP